MRSWNPPTDAELDRLGALDARTENRTYFFCRLENPEWIPALAARGYFDNPPARMDDDRRPGYVWFPPWPEGQYLVRMASVAPKDVAHLLRKHTRSDNPNVTCLALKAFVSLPDEQVFALVLKALEWIKSPRPRKEDAADTAEDFSDEAASAIRRMLEVGATKQALSAVSILLKPEPKAFPGSRFEVNARLSEWKYDRILRSILPSLVDVAGLEGVETLSWLLMDAISSSRGAQRPGESGDEYSFIWRPAIASHGQNHDDGVRGTLISAVRDAAVRFAEIGDVQVGKVVQELESKSLVHRRIALHVLAVTSGAVDLVVQRLSDRNLFDDRRVRHEYASLLRARFGGLPSVAQATYLDWVDQGPDINALRQPGIDGSVPSEEDVSHWAERWQRDRLSVVAMYLRGEYLDWYQDLVTRFGELEHANFSVWSSGAAWLESPSDGDEFAGRSPSEVIRYLHLHQPSGDPATSKTTYIEGLREILRATVKDRAEEFALLSDDVAPLAPTYVSHFISGLEDAVTAGIGINWEEPLRLAEVVVSYPFEPTSAERSQNGDCDWSWARRSVVSLLRAGFRYANNRIPFSLRRAVWRILERLTHDPHDSTAGELFLDGRQLDVFTQSVNTTRGLAMHGVVEYVLWCRQELESLGEDVSQGLHLIPEARDALERHLDPDHDLSPVVRAVYGDSIPWLVLVDKSWVTSNLRSIFPVERECVDLTDAAWTTYLRWCSPYDSIYDVLQNEYADAVERVPSDGFGASPYDDSVDAKLGEHLVTFYWRGVAPRPLIERYFARADDKLAGSTMEFLGKTLEDSEDSIPEEILQRIQELWDLRLLALETACEGEVAESPQREAESFGLTFVSGKLSEDWSFSSLERSLRIGGGGWYGMRVVERLASLASTRPVDATRLTLELLRNTANVWDHHTFEDSVHSMLDATVNARDLKTQENRRAIIDHYVARGQHAFRELL